MVAGKRSIARNGLQWLPQMLAHFVKAIGGSAGHSSVQRLSVPPWHSNGIDAVVPPWGVPPPAEDNPAPRGSVTARSAKAYNGRRNVRLLPGAKAVNPGFKVVAFEQIEPALSSWPFEPRVRPAALA